MTETIRRHDDLPRLIAKLQRDVVNRSFRGHSHLRAIQSWTRVEQSIPDSTNTQWSFNSSEFTAGSTDLWSNSAGTLTVNSAGVYQLDFGFRWVPLLGSTDRRLHDIRVNGTSVVRQDDTASVTAPAGHIARKVSLAASDEVTASVRQESGASLGFGGDERSFFQIEALHLT